MRGPFRKNRDRLLAAHRVTQIVDLIADAQPVFAADKDSVVNRAKPADQRPFFDPVIGDKGAAGYTGYDRNVDPAMVIGGVEDIFADALTAGCGRNAGGPADRQQEKSWPGCPKIRPIGLRCLIVAAECNAV